MSVKLNVRMEMPGKEPKEFDYDFSQDVITLGRDSHNDIQIPLTTVSRNHARITREGTDYFLEDLKSTHGTNHNGKPMGSGGKKLLRNGDVIELMHFRITFRSESDKPLEMGQAEKTEMLARRMVQEVLSSISPTQEHPYLRVMNGPDEGKRFELSEGVGEVVIGRATECDFHINDANISRRHALVRKDWTGITVEDLGSKNGVLINEKKIEKPSPLRDSDEIALGAVKLTFIDPAASMIGKLDDIPIWKDANPEEEAPQEEEEEAPAEEAAAAPEGGADGASIGPPPGTEGADGEASGTDGEAGKAGDGGKDGAEGADDPKPASTSNVLLYAAVGVVVLGLAVAGVVVVSML